MNSAKSVNGRLVKLFQAKTIRQHFEVRGRKVDDFLDGIEGLAQNGVVNDFVLGLKWTAKQHVYILEGVHRILTANLANVEWPDTPINEAAEDGWRVLTFLPVVRYRVHLANDYEQLEIRCKQPIIVRQKGQHICIHAVILEKNAMNYLSPADKDRFLKAERLDDEEDLIGRYIAAIRAIFAVAPMDITKGVKELVEKGDTDFAEAKWRKDKSICTETMDEDETIKQAYPEQYEDMIKRPIKSSVFKYKKDDDAMTRKFKAEPEKGMLSFNIFPQTENQICHVVNEILRHNR